MRIVVDAMGSDRHPVPDVGGAVQAAQEWGDEIILVGDAKSIEAELTKYNTDGLKLRIVHASQVIEMTDKPAESARSKPDSSMHVGMHLVQSREADAFVTAGNTGAVLAVATLHTLKRIQGIKRPALSVIYPSPNGYTVSADAGANADCRPDQLVQFAQMASAYAELVLKIKEPRVALLSNGEEEGKGNELIHATVPLMKETKKLNFIGNVEPKEVLGGVTDVVIHDGFTGNIMMKSMEAALSMLFQLMRQEIKASPLTALGGQLAKPALRRVARAVDPAEIGGAPLLGVNGVVIIGHGRSNDVAIKNAVRQARQAVESGLIEAIRAGVEG